MSKDFGIDNEGSGFDFDDDEDLEAMLNKANQGEETGEDDDSHLAYIYNDNFPQRDNGMLYEADKHREQEPTPVQNAWEAPEEPTVEQPTVSEKVPTYDETTETTSQANYQEFEEYKAPEEVVEESQYVAEPTAPVQSQYTAPETVQPKPVEEYRISSDYHSSSPVSSPVPEQLQAVPEPSPVVEQTVSSSRRLNISTEAEDIESVQKTIRILDAYRKLNSKAIVAQLIYNENDVDPNDEAALVVKVLRSDPMLGKMMTVLRESASEKDRVERVFYILDTDHNVLKYLGSFLETVSEVNFENTHNHISFAKEIEKSIDELDSKIVQHVADAQSVLAAAEDEKE